MLTRFVRTQLVIFSLASLIAMSVMFVAYLQVPTLLGINRYTVELELPSSAGLYRFGNVTLRGVQIGKVTEVVPTGTGARAKLVLDTSPKVPADLQAHVRSVSAVGEQYVDLVPRTDSGPYLRDGSVIAAENTTVPQQVGPMLDRLARLVDSIPEQRLSHLLDESYRSLNGAGPDLGSLLDSSSTLGDGFGSVRDQTQMLIADSVPLLESQAQTADSIRQWAGSLSAVTGQLVTNDPEIRGLLRGGPGAFDETARLLDEVKPTLPVLLANLTTIGQIGVTYNASLEQLLVLLPNYVGQLQTFGMTKNNPTGISVGDFSLTISDPPACTVGFLPPSSWRSPADLTDVDTPDGLYCKLPQDSPISVRGARNYPCMAVPGKRAATVQDCLSDRTFQPLAKRQNALGPYPIDPNLVAQGIPIDSRVGNDTTTLDGPPLGAPLPPDAVTPALAPPVPAQNPTGQGSPEPAEEPLPRGAAATPVTPSSSVAGASEQGLSIARYDPRTGLYVGQNGAVYRQTDLVSSEVPKTWKDMLPT